MRCEYGKEIKDYPPVSKPKSYEHLVSSVTINGEDVVKLPQTDFYASYSMAFTSYYDKAD